MRLRQALTAMTATAVLLASGCADDDTPARPDPVEREVAIYVATIRALVLDVDPDAGDGGIDAVVYVASREDQPISIDVQAGVVVELDDWSTIRFIDSPDEAIDNDDEELPVRDGGILLGLGAIPEGEREVELYADRYDGPGRAIVFEVRLRRTGDVWMLADPLRGVPVAVADDLDG